MTESAFRSEDCMGEAGVKQGEKARLLQRIAELEREIMKMQRTGKVLRDIEQRKRLASAEAEPDPSFALQALNCCPGLLCFAVDKSGVLLYSTRGYREIARRFLGHECAAGLPYPAGSDTPFELDLQDLLQEAFLGGTAAVTLAETGGNMNRWRVTGAPLLSAAGTVTGAIVSLTPIHQRDENEVPPGLPRADCGDASDFPDFLDFLDCLPGMFFVSDDDGRCIEANVRFLSVMKLSRGAVTGRCIGEFFTGGAAGEDISAGFLKALREGALDMECTAPVKDGDVLSLSLKGARLQWKGETCTLVNCADNTKLRRAEEQLKRVSVTDASTGILNRQGMERVLDSEIERAARYKGSLSIIMLDIDGFRRLNERLGYSASDRILKDLASAVKARIHLTDFLGRWGGDEFMVLTPAPLAQAAQLAEKLRDMAQHMPFAEDRKDRLTLSAGVAEFRKAMDISSFVGAAYDAMAEAKRSGGNRVERGKGPEVQPGG